MRASQRIQECSQQIPGLKVQGEPVGPALALVADTSVPRDQQVDPHHLADEMARLGFKIQHQPGHIQSDGVKIPHSAHLTITPVTEATLPEFCAALEAGAAAVRGQARPKVELQLRLLRLLGYGRRNRVPTPEMAWRILRFAGAGGESLPGNMAPLMALVERLPGPVAEVLLSELLARVSEPGTATSQVVGA